MVILFDLPRNLNELYSKQQALMQMIFKFKWLIKFFLCDLDESSIS
jgi:hypothetical protein